MKKKRITLPKLIRAEPNTARKICLASVGNGRTDLEIFAIAFLLLRKLPDNDEVLPLFGELARRHNWTTGEISREHLLRLLADRLAVEFLQTLQRRDLTALKGLCRTMERPFKIADRERARLLWLSDWLQGKSIVFKNLKQYMRWMEERDPRDLRKLAKDCGVKICPTRGGN